jgi:2-polyprenyl-3-methyl-5-hydroxy-6-metoxy-1,4-benzoquinol methylase
LADILERTERALAGDEQQLRYDGIDVCDFVELELVPLSGILSTLSRYSILDAGCGFGRFSRFLAGFDCRQFVGIDPVEARVMYASAHYGGAGMSFIAGDVVENFKHWSQVFDVCYCRTVLQHLPYRKKLEVLETLGRLTNPGGYVVLYDGRIWKESIDYCADYYVRKGPAHMIPIPLDDVCKSLKCCSLYKTYDEMFIFKKV